MKNAIHISVILFTAMGTYGCSSDPDLTSRELLPACNQPQTTTDTGTIIFYSTGSGDYQQLPENTKTETLNNYKKRSAALLHTNYFFEQEPEEKAKKEVLLYKGVYSFDNKRYLGMVDLNNLQPDGNINFVISIASSLGCTSSLKGRAKFIKDNIATYRDSASGCSLSFVFTKNNLLIKENKCRFFHGESCQFKGNFNRD